MDGGMLGKKHSKMKLKKNQTKQSKMYTFS